MKVRDSDFITVNYTNKFPSWFIYTRHAVIIINNENFIYIYVHERLK